VVETIFDCVAEAQAGLIRRDRIAPSLGGSPHNAVIPVTAKDHLRSVEDREKRLEIRSAALLLPSGGDTRARLDLDDLNWTCLPEHEEVLLESETGPVKWGFGVDISKGHRIESYAESVTSETASFKLVERNFVFEKDKKSELRFSFTESRLWKLLAKVKTIL
jgi:hypothetical protein